MTQRSLAADILLLYLDPVTFTLWLLGGTALDQWEHFLPCQLPTLPQGHWLPNVTQPVTDCWRAHLLQFGSTKMDLALLRPQLKLAQRSEFTPAFVFLFFLFHKCFSQEYFFPLSISNLCVYIQVFLTVSFWMLTFWETARPQKMHLRFPFVGQKAGVLNPDWISFKTLIILNVASRVPSFFFSIFVSLSSSLLRFFAELSVFFWGLH